MQETTARSRAVVVSGAAPTRRPPAGAAQRAGADTEAMKASTASV
jgi:hypothetical protein